MVQHDPKMAAKRSRVVSATDPSVEELTADPTRLEQLVSEYRILREAIERSPVPYCVYDDTDCLIAFNSAYERLHPALADLRRAAPAGVRISYADLIRHQYADKLTGRALEDEVQKRLLEQRAADGTPVERTYATDETFRVHKYPLASGGVAGLAFNITELKRRESELTDSKAQAEEASRKARTALATERLRKRQSRNLSELSEWLQSCKSLDELFEIVRRFMSGMFPTSSGELYVYSNSRDVLDGAAEWRRAGQLHAHIHPDDCWALRRGRMLRYGSGFADLACCHAQDVEETKEPVSYICIPIVAHGDTVGLLHIRFEGDSKTDATEEADRSAFAIQCAEQISLAIANVRLRDELHEQSSRDPLTGLYNRRYFMNQLRRDLCQAGGDNGPVSVIALDADNFKSFNDTHGHDAGDTVLRKVAELMLDHVGDQGTVARLGGEEFAILLPSVDQPNAEDCANRLRARVESLTIRYGDGALPRITVSAGVAVATHPDVQVQDLLRDADAALYAAKDAGRNQVRCAT